MTPHATFYWNELITDDVDAAKGFYSTVLGWKTEAMPMDQGGEYTIVVAPTGPAGGIMNVKQTNAPDDTPPHWFAYIAVDDVDAALAKVPGAGGKVTVPAFDVPDIGRIACIEDPTGAVVGVMTPAPQEGAAAA